MVQYVTDVSGMHPDVDRVEHRPGLQDPKVRLEQVVGIVGDERDDLTGSDPQILDGGGETARAFAELGVREALLPVDDADLAAEEPLCAPPELQRCDRDKHRPALLRAFSLPSTSAPTSQRVFVSHYLLTSRARRGASTPSGQDATSPETANLPEAPPAF